jgi:hypothetical protein
MSIFKMKSNNKKAIFRTLQIKKPPLWEKERGGLGICELRNSEEGCVLAL